MTTADETYDFTEREFKVIFGVCCGLANKDMAQQYGIPQELVMMAMSSIYDKLYLSTRLELVEFAKTALNVELLRRRGDPSFSFYAEWDRPRMTREQIAKLVVGQEVNIGCGPYSGEGKVVKVHPLGVDVLVKGTKGDEIFRFDKDGDETDDSRRDRFGFGPPFAADDNFHTVLWYGAPECQPYYLVQDETVN